MGSKETQRIYLRRMPAMQMSSCPSAPKSMVAQKSTEAIVKSASNATQQPSAASITLVTTVASASGALQRRPSSTVPHWSNIIYSQWQQSAAKRCKLAGEVKDGVLNRTVPEL